ncbi:MAG TPA: hypothetical protein VEJ68_05890 [Candidatus Bathyarchaeia archaeon]|nr:hypothetical protein [Candidatus Bathyarchaeia archaeon]
MNFKTLLPMTLFATVLGSTFAGAAFADNQDVAIAYSNFASTYVQGIQISICGSHQCSPGEIPHDPLPVEPVGGH